MNFHDAYIVEVFCKYIVTMFFPVKCPWNLILSVYLVCIISWFLFFDLKVKEENLLSGVNYIQVIHYNQSHTKESFSQLVHARNLSNIYIYNI